MTKMTWKAFTRKLFDPALTDSDPGYLLLYGADIKTSQKMRFMTAWVTFYNIGIAARASEFTGQRFWRYLHEQYPTVKRSSERRHFRGAAGLKALRSWQQKFPEPENLVNHMQGEDYFEVKHKASMVPQIGEYFCWKFADVQERVFGIPCDFPDAAAKHSPKVPQQGAKLIWPDTPVLSAYLNIADYMNDEGIKAPPGWDRAANMQESETVCCIYKQYMHDKWVPGSRTAKAIRSLLATRSDTGDEMLEQTSYRIKVKTKDLDEWSLTKLEQLGQ